MFCHKCGAQIADGAAFCHKCGAKMGNTDTTPQIPNIPARTSEPREATQPQTHDVPSDTPKKKKLGKLPIILGAVALVVVVIIVIAMNWNGKIDYEATVRAHQPFVSQGTSLTYGEVLDKYISSPNWEIRKSGEVNYVDISGNAKETDKDLVVTIKVVEDSSDPDLASISPESVTIDDVTTPTENDAVEFLLAMFLMYEEGYDNVSDLFSETAIPSETQSPNTADVNFEGVSLSQLLYLPADEVIALLGPPVVHDEYKLAYDTIEFDLDGGRITGAESFNPEKFLISGTPLAQNRSMLPALLGEPTHEGEGGSGYEMTFEQNGYVLTIATADKDGTAWRIFITPNLETGNQAGGEIFYKGHPVAQLLGSTQEELNQIFGAPTDTGILYGATEYYTYNDISFILGDQGATVNITVAADAAEINGATLDQNRTGIINLLGPPSYEGMLPEDESGEGLGGYYVMEYLLNENGILYTVEMLDANSIASSVTINWLNDGPDDAEYQESLNDTANPNSVQNGGMVSYTDLLGTWQWQGKNVVDAVLGIGGTKQLTLYSNGTCKGEIATSDNVNGEFVAIFAPTAWSFLEYEQVLQVSAMTTGWDWGGPNGTPIEVPVYKTMNFKVSMSGNTMYLENVENPDSKDIEYIKLD